MTQRYIVVTPTLQLLWLDPVWAPPLALSEATPQEILELFQKKGTLRILGACPHSPRWMSHIYNLKQNVVSSKECATACSPTLPRLSISVTDK